MALMVLMLGGHPRPVHEVGGQVYAGLVLCPDAEDSPWQPHNSIGLRGVVVKLRLARR